MLLRRTCLLLVFAIVLTIALPINASAEIEDSADQSQVYIPALGKGKLPLCRFGVNNSIFGYDTTQLRSGWFVDYVATFNTNRIPYGVEYFPTIRLTQTGAKTFKYSIKPAWGETTEAELKAQIASRPGSHWLIGNEPDRYNRILAGQDDVEPQIYAIAYHHLYNLIKSEDPSAVVVAGNIVQPTVVRLKYLNAVLAAYQQEFGTSMPVDAWAVHAFILNEYSCDAVPSDVADPTSICWGAEIPPGVDDTTGMIISTDQNDDFELFKQNIYRFRQWMKDHGYGGLPLYVTEYGVLFGGPGSGWESEYPASRVTAFMDKTFDYMLNIKNKELGDPNDDYRMIQRFSWYSVRDTTFNGSLFEQNRTLSPLGQHYASATQAIKIRSDFHPADFTATVTASGIKLNATIANSGNSGPEQEVTVRFYRNNPEYNGVQIGSDHRISLTGCGDTAEVSEVWDQTVPGDYNLFVYVVPSVQETDISNNKLKTSITIPAASATKTLEGSGYQIASSSQPLIQ